MNHHENDPSEWIRTALEQFQGPLLRYAFRFTNDMDRARDVVQDVFIKLCAEDRSKLKDRLAPWLYTVCRNRALDILRKEGKMQSLAENEVPNHDSTHQDPSRVMVENEAKHQVLQLLQKLPANQQEVIRLKFQDGLSYKEISSVTRLSVTNVGFLIHTGIKSLRHQLASEGGLL